MIARTVEAFTELAAAALAEAGRVDLAHGVLGFTNDDGTFYLEPLDAEELDRLDLDLIERAAHLAAGAVGGPA